MDLVISLLHRNEEMSLAVNRRDNPVKLVMYAVWKGAIIDFARSSRQKSIFRGWQ